MRPSCTLATAAALLLLLALASALLISAQALHKYPHLRCSSCKAMCEVLGDKMNETAKAKSTILASHRIEKGGVGRRVDYESSELRGYELLEKLCDQNNFGSYMLREQPRTGLRIFSREGALQQCLPYDDKDRAELHDTMANKFVSQVCLELVEMHEEEIVAAVKKLRKLDELTTRVCEKSAKLCVGKKYAKAVKKDLDARAAWRKRTGIRTGTDVDNDEAKKKAEDAAKKAAEDLKAPVTDAEQQQQQDDDKPAGVVTAPTTAEEQEQMIPPPTMEEPEIPMGMPGGGEL